MAKIKKPILKFLILKDDLYNCLKIHLSLVKIGETVNKTFTKTFKGAFIMVILITGVLM